MNPSLAVSLAVFLLTCGFVVGLWGSRRRVYAGHPLPPGPSPTPIVGNVIGIDPAEPWISYTHWARIYGNVFYIRLLNQEFIFLNSEEVAKDLLERRSHNYSDRPAMMSKVSDFFGWSFFSIMAPYGDRWRFHRRLFHQAFRAQAAVKYHPLQLQKARDLVLNLLETPEQYVTHLHTLSISIVMAVVYGYEPTRQNDPIVNVVEKALELASAGIRTEVAIVLSFFPPVQYFPSWFPGASFKRTAHLCRKYAADMVDIPFHFVTKSMDTGTAAPSMVSDSLKRQGADDESVRAIKESSATVFAAASETTASTLWIFILAMLLHPDCQARAQAEIDSVVGDARLPTFEDRPSLPYVEAILRETLRWHPVTPLGVPHATIGPDVYEGHYIPKGATVITNIWAMTRNEAKYAEPERFLPERFLLEDGELNDDTVAYAFGGGRRVCVGRYLADASIWSAMVSILAVFKIVPSKDERGNDVPVEPRWSAAITSHPLEFPCQFVPRTPGLTAETLSRMC